MGTYRVLLKRGGEPLWDLSNFVRLEYARAINQVGAATVVINRLLDAEMVTDNITMTIYREHDRHISLEGNTTWFLASAALDCEAGFTELHFKDANVLLNRRIVAYTSETTYADKTIEEGAEGTAGELIEAFMSENLHSSAVDTDRSLAEHLSMDVTGVGAADVEKSAAWQPLLTVLSDIAQQSAELDAPIYFDITGDDNMKFIVRDGCLGVDRTLGVAEYPVMLQESRGDLIDVTVRIDYEEQANVAYVGGYGNGASRMIAVVLSPEYRATDRFNRSETFVDARDYDVESVLQREGQTALRRTRAKWKLEASVANLGQFAYGKHYTYGDKVTCFAAGKRFDCMIDAIDMRVDRSGNYETEELSIRLQGELV